jgi:hypothetical protein
MESYLLTVMPELGIGISAIAALVYVVRQFLDTLTKIRENHEASMSERERALRQIEAEFRNSTVKQLIRNTEVMKETTRALTEVSKYLERSTK